MGEIVFFNLKYDGEAKLISVNSTTSFDDFIAQASGKWNELRDLNLLLRYSIGDVRNCSLDCEDDLRNLFSICQILSAKIVFVDNSKIVEKQILMIEQQTDTFDQHEHVYDPNEHVHVDHEHVYVDHMAQGRQMEDKYYSSESDFVVNRRSRTTKTVSLKTTRQNHLYDKFGVMPSYDVCPELKNKPLLSDNWCHILDGGVGTTFSEGANEFRTELIKYATHLGFRFKYTKNNKSYIYAVCGERDNCGCSWFIKAKLQTITNFFVVTKVALDHSCIGKLVGNKNTRFGAKILGNLVVENIRADPNCNGKDIQKTLRLSYGLHFPYWKAWRAYESGMHNVFGSYDDSYDQLRWYCNAIERANEGSIVSLESNPNTNCFERVFIAFKACLDGFKKCRPMLFIDGTFMIGRAKGTLLGATAKDGDNGLLPVAIAIVSAENTSNWVWFLEKLRDLVHYEKEICYLSDRNTGLISAFPKGWTNDQRENLGVHFKNCAYAPNIRIFNEKVAIFKAVGGRTAEEWISELPLDKWAVAHSPNIKRYGEMTSNAAEQFNAWIKEARSLPITYMIEHIRRGISQWIVHRRQDSLKWTGALCPRKENLWNFFVNLSRSWMVVDCPSGKFDVLSCPNAVVDLQAKECSCYQWQVRGFPCVHAVAVIIKKCPTVYSIVEEHFFTNTYRACYRFDIHAIPQTEKFEFQPSSQNSTKILPPIMKRQPGRPKVKRKPSFGEFPKKKPTKACVRCGNLSNHDPTTCLLPHEEAMWF
ncbi:hypothetical protein OROGR_022883 [Orobanche gracilis]